MSFFRKAGGILKIQYKAASIMILFGVIIAILLALGYDKINHRMIIDKEKKNIESISEEVASHVESHLKAKATIAVTLASAPLVRDALLKSNSAFSSLADGTRKKEIENRNEQWKKTSDINAPFIKAHMTNPVAEYLKHQQVLIPEEYGEIFLTNRYGVMIATTGKLSTLAHGHKYWWVACYDDGKGRILLDDRGFDKSVQGYVLGVVIPIIDKNEVIGILKCNVNVMGPLTDVVQNFDLRNSGEMKIVRTGGLVVSARGIAPLTIQINEAIAELLRTKESGTTITNVNDESQFVAFSPIRITMGSEHIGFGGSQESIDHIKGNKGEAWHVIISRNEKEVIETAHETTSVIIIVGIVFTLFTTAIALFLGKLAAKPIVELATVAENIGEGHLDTRTSVSSNDEFGLLAKSLNRMAKNLQETMTSRDELVYEVEQRKKEKKEKEQLIVELQDALHEVKTLRGIIPICSFCKKIRDDKGYWNQVEVYVQEHTEANFSHSFCPECVNKHYPEFVDKLADK